MKKLSILFLCLTLSTAVAKPTIKIESLQGITITPKTVGDLSGLGCRNFDKIVHLNINVTWPLNTEGKPKGSAPGDIRLIFATDDAEFLFPRGTYTYMHGSWVVDGYFIVTSGGTHEGVISYAFEPVDRATVLLNPYVREFSLNRPSCP